jgi:hypothetical protein
MPPHTWHWTQELNCDSFRLALNRVARWHIFTPKIPIWVNFGGSSNGIFMAIWSIFGHLVYFVAMWYVYFRGYLVYIFDMLQCCTVKNLATLALKPKVVLPKKYRLLEKLMSNRKWAGVTDRPATERSARFTGWCPKHNSTSREFEKNGAPR